MARIVYPGIKGNDSSLNSPNHKDLLSQEFPEVKKNKKVKVIAQPIIIPSQKGTGIPKKESGISPQAKNKRDEQSKENGKKVKGRKIIPVKIQDF